MREDLVDIFEMRSRLVDMTNEETEIVHYWPSDAELTGCRLVTSQGRTEEWAEVTCGACRLEQPMDTRGNPERHLAPAVAEYLAVRRPRAEVLAAVASVEDQALEEIVHWSGVLSRAIALRNRLSATEVPEAPA